MGFPQGAVSSPLLWNFFTRDLDKVAFADDFHEFFVSKSVDAISGGLNAGGEEMLAWANENEMSISAPKSTTTLFTPWTKQVNATLDVEIGNEPVPTDKNPRLLGVLLDPLFTFSAHAAAIARKSSSSLNLMRAISDTHFGKDKDCLSLMHKCFIRSVFNYAAPIVYPLYSPSSIAKLQNVQNKSLRLVTGCHLKTSIDHLHAEAQELPVDDHLLLLSSQFFAKSLDPSHVSHPFTTLDQGPRKLRHTLRSKVIDVVQPYMNADGTISRADFHQVKNSLHTDIVRRAISRAGNNRVLGRPPPPVHNNENHLPRLTRVTLAQLRSGQCARLRDFQFTIGKSPDNICRHCTLEPQTVIHLFNCPAKPTTLTELDLWLNPWGVADYLRLLPDFSDLQPPTPLPPPRRRPPRRPPPDPPDFPIQAPDSPVFSPFSDPPSPFDFSPPDSPVPLLLLPFSPPPPRP